MSEVLPRHYWFGIILFVFVLTGGFYLMSSFGSEQPALLEDNKLGEFGNYLNSTAESVYSTSADLEAKTSADQQEQSAFGWLNSLIGTSWTILKGFYSTFSFANDAFTNLGGIFGLPGWIMSILLVCISSLIAFAILSAIFQKDI